MSFKIDAEDFKKKYILKENEHPIYNPDSKHYKKDGKNTIEKIEDDLNLCEMMGFCRGNIRKYKDRLDAKGQKESDLKKIDTYENYLAFLLFLQHYVEQDRDNKYAISVLSVSCLYREYGIRFYFGVGIS